MKKILFFFYLLITCSLYATPQAIVFDFGGVMNAPTPSNREAPVQFIRKSLHLSQEEYDRLSEEMRASVVQGGTDEKFWLSYAKSHGIELLADWSKSLRAALKKSLGANPKMYALVDQLKEHKYRVALLSNTTPYRAKLIRSFGLYQPFDPCILSCEVGLRKPDPKIYALLLERLNLPASRVIFIDDKLANIEAARKIGIDGIVFESEEQLRFELNQKLILEKQ